MSDATLGDGACADDGSRPDLEAGVPAHPPSGSKAGPRPAEELEQAAGRRARVRRPRVVAALAPDDAIDQPVGRSGQEAGELDGAVRVTGAAAQALHRHRSGVPVDLPGLTAVGGPRVAFGSSTVLPLVVAVLLVGDSPVSSGHRLGLGGRAGRQGDDKHQDAQSCTDD